MAPEFIDPDPKPSAPLACWPFCGTSAAFGYLATTVDGWLSPALFVLAVLCLLLAASSKGT